VRHTPFKLCDLNRLRCATWCVLCKNDLKQQIRKLSFEIDQAQRKKEFEELTSSEFYTDLKSQAQKLRQQRAERAKRYANKDLEEK
jgi:hypothetical protein